MKNYIPKRKDDPEAIANLKKLTFEAVRVDVPELLEWMQDMNWPVAHEVYDYLLPHIREIQRELYDILISDDIMWIYWIIGFITSSSERPDDDVLALISRMANSPTDFEKSEDIDERAKEAIAKFA